MTLTEYLNQVDPIRMPNVVLVKSEYRVIDSIKQGQNKITFIEIPALYKRFGIDGTYQQINDFPELYTITGDGNKRAVSCFRMPYTFRRDANGAFDIPCCKAVAFDSSGRSFQ